MHSPGRNLRLVPASDVIVGLSGRTIGHSNVVVPSSLRNRVPSCVDVSLGNGHVLCGDRLVVLRVLTGAG